MARRRGRPPPSQAALSGEMSPGMERRRRPDRREASSGICLCRACAREGRRASSGVAMGAQLRLVRRRSAPATSTLLRSQSSPASPDMEAEQPSASASWTSSCTSGRVICRRRRRLRRGGALVVLVLRRVAVPVGEEALESQLVGRALHSRSSGPCGDMAALLILAALIRRLLLILLGGGWRCCHQLPLPHGSGGGGALSTGRSSQFHHCHPLNQVSSWIPIANSISFYVCPRVV